MNTLKEQWKDLCNQYALEFATKHGYDIDYELKHEYLWVGNDPGTVCEMADMFVGIDDMRYDIDTNQPEENFEKWYWKGVEVYETTGKHYMNYESFCKGCPDTWTKEKLDNIKKLKNNVQEAKNLLIKQLEEYGVNSLPQDL